MILLTGGCFLSGGCFLPGLFLHGWCASSRGGGLPLWGASSRWGMPPPRGGLVQTPSWMATAAGGMHPTGMHSCYRRRCNKNTGME